VDRAGVEIGEIGFGGARRKLAVERIARLQDDLFAFFRFENRVDVRVIAVVTEVGLFGERFPTVDANLLCHSFLPLSDIFRMDDPSCLV